VISHTHQLKVKLAPLLALIASLVATRAPAQSARRTWNFDQHPVGKLPLKFTSALTGQGTIGQWAVMKDESAPRRPMSWPRLPPIRLTIGFLSLSWRTAITRTWH
jgi:hypothetical protein